MAKRTVFLLLSLIGIATSVSIEEQAAQTSIISLKPGCDGQNFLKSVDFQGKHLTHLGMIVMSASRADMENHLQTRTNIADCVNRIENDAVHSLPEAKTGRKVDLSEASAPSSAVNTWHLDRVDQRASELDGDSFRNTYSFNTVNAYVIDTGVDRFHPELADRCPTDESEHYEAYGSDDPCDFYACDSFGHGTHVSGLIGSLTYGYNPHVTIHAVKVFNWWGYTTTSALLDGMNWVVEHDQEISISEGTRTTSSVANMSFGGGINASLDDGVKALTDIGITVVVAAGNSSTDACTFSPAHIPEVITVGASEQGDARAYFSNYGDCVDVYAPGYLIWSTLPNNQVGEMSGTSMASPIVAGIVSASLAETFDAAHWDPARMQEALKCNATPDVITDSVEGTKSMVYDVNSSECSPSSSSSWFSYIVGAIVFLITLLCNLSVRSGILRKERDTFQETNYEKL
mmetsp:Transcript_19526/g.22192  ORF Transcript_19526/g.22192 Transcript_19526/m.22192 type:complete len:459 (+) Transcript_19526:223-1599(+)